MSLQDELSRMKEEAIRRKQERENQKPVHRVDRYINNFEVDVALRNGTRALGRKWTVKINLPKDRPLLVGFDQSTTQTGICILDDNQNLVCLIDFINKNADTNAYIVYLKKFMERLFKDTMIALLIYEQPYGGFRYSNNVLNQLLGCLKNLSLELPEFKGVPTKFIMPNQWRSGFLTSKDYKGRHTRDKVKQAVREEFCIREPQLKTFAYYKGESNNKVPDSLEAYGVVKGYLAKNYSDDGLQKISKSIKFRNISYDKQRVRINLEEFKKTFKEKNDKEPSHEDIAWEVLSKSKNGAYMLAQTRGLSVMLYNTDLTFNQNTRLACCATNNVIVLAIPFNDLYSKYIWEDGVPLRRGEVFYAVCYKK